ncbi:MAG: hypothetical protein AAGD14_12895 [Planctomycetota bacterium]
MRGVGVMLLLVACGRSDDLAPRVRAMLAEGELRAAEALLEGREDVDALRGHLLFAQAKQAGRQAEDAGSEPFALDFAVRLAERAGVAWQSEAVSGDEVSRRNAERAWLLADDLRRKRDAAQRERKKTGDPEFNPKPLPDDPDPKPEDAEPPEAPKIRALSADEVRQLADRLAQKERRKMELRQKERVESEQERDW